MGNSQSASSIKINYEDVQYIIKNAKDQHLLINTLSNTEQTCLIVNTIPMENEETVINALIKDGHKDYKLIVYGKNCNDDRIYTKYTQLTSLGFINVYLYVGGLFEWLMLQDIYGENDFLTTTREINLLKFKPNKVLNVPLLH